MLPLNFQSRSIEDNVLDVYTKERIHFDWFSSAITLFIVVIVLGFII